MQRLASARDVVGRVLGLVLVWSCVWLFTLRVMPPFSPAISFVWWSTMKLIVWIGLASVCLRPSTRDAWLGRYEAHGPRVLLLALVWVLADVVAVRSGVKRVPDAPVLDWPMLNVLVLAPLLEELLFRGIVWSALEATGMPRGRVCALSASCFATLHLPGWIAMRGVSATLMSEWLLVFAVGLLAGAGRWWTGSIWAAVFLHFVNNAASIGVFRALLV